MTQRAWHHFTVRRLIFLTTAIAVICGLLASIRMPQFMRATFIAVLAAQVAYLFFRLPVMWAGMQDLRRRRQQLIDHRRELAAEVERLKHERDRATPRPELDRQ
jgi:uncharacterized membrane protein YfcA